MPLIKDPMFGINSPMGFFSKNTLLAYTNNISSLKNLRTAFFKAKKPIKVDTYYRNYHILIQKNKSPIQLPPGVLKSYAQVFSFLKQSLQKNQKKIIKNRYDVGNLLPKSDTTSPNPMNVN